MLPILDQSDNPAQTEYASSGGLGAYSDHMIPGQSNQPPHSYGLQASVSSFLPLGKFAVTIASIVVHYRAHCVSCTEVTELFSLLHVIILLLL